MKLISLNIEGRRHLNRITDLFASENPDVVCLQEADHTAIEILEDMHYHCTFMPIVLRRQKDDSLAEEGCVFASKQTHAAHTHFYYQADKELKIFERDNKRATTSNGYIFGEVDIDSILYRIATTHFTWTQHGNLPNEYQKADIDTMLSALRNEQPHILCGDMNIPRHHSELYGKFLDKYTDAVPEEYGSSLDKEFHRVRDSVDHAHLFTDYMVDYVLTQAPYITKDTSLRFGVSDHAAVISNITSQ